MAIIHIEQIVCTDSRKNRRRNLYTKPNEHVRVYTVQHTHIFSIKAIYAFHLFVLNICGIDNTQEMPTHLNKWCTCAFVLQNKHTYTFTYAFTYTNNTQWYSPIFPHCLPLFSSLCLYLSKSYPIFGCGRIKVKN